jgi:hypothetical protein
MAPNDTARERLQLLLTFFPEVDLPVTITVSSRKAFEERNRPLPQLIQATFLDLWEGEAADMYTEYIPGFHFANGRYRVLVYWKAALLHYAYILVVLDQDGLLTDRLVLVETDATDGHLRQGAAMITADREIWTVESTAGFISEGVVPDHAIAEKWTITEEGRIQAIHQSAKS